MNNSHCWPHPIMHCHQWSLTTSNNAIPSKKFYHICVSRISLMMCPACWRAYKHKIIHYNCLCIAIMSIFSPQKSTKWLYTMSCFKTDVISLLVNNDQSDTSDAHSNGQIQNKTEPTANRLRKCIRYKFLNCKEGLPKQLFLK
jgi:hypothetical protein